MRIFSKVGEIVKKLIKTGFLYVFGSSVINKIIHFLSSIVLVRILSKTEYGVFAYAWNIYSLLVLFEGMGMAPAVLQLSSENTNDRAKIKGVFDYGVKFGSIANLILMVIMILIGLFVPFKIEGSGILLILLAALPALQFFCASITNVVRSIKLNKSFGKLTTVSTILTFCMCVIGAYTFREKGLVLGYYVSTSISLILCVNVFKKNFKSKTPLDNTDKKPMRSIAFITMCNSALSQLLYLADVFVLGIVIPQETIIASYKVATVIPTALSFIPSIMVTYLYPYLAEHRNDAQWCLKTCKTVFLGMGVLNAIISTTLVIFGELVIKIFFGAQYLDALPIFRLLSVNYFFSGTFRTLAGLLLVTQRKLKFNLFVAILTGSVNVIADVFFIQWWGSMGAAFATVLVVLLSSILNVSYLFYTLNKKLKKGEN